MPRSVRTQSATLACVLPGVRTDLGEEVTKAAPKMETGRDELEPACAGQPEPYDTLIDTTGGPDYNRAVEKARALCGACPLQARCLVENRHEPWVIAMIAGPRQSTRTKGSQVAARCGTDGGYYRHLRGTKAVPRSRPCDACREAHRIYQAKRVAEKTAEVAA